VRECCERARHALTVLDGLPAGAVDAVCEMKLCAAYASSLMHAGDNVSVAVSLWERVLRLARASHDGEFTADALWGLWNTMLAVGDIHASLRYATRFQHAATRGDSPWRKWLAEQMIATSLHCAGEHEQARERLECAVEAISALGASNPAGGWLTVYPLINSSGTLARIALLQCKPAQAMRLVERALALIRGDMLEPSLSLVLAAVAIPIALECGEHQAASSYLELLRSQAASHRLDVWLDYAECLAAKIDMMAGRSGAALERLEPALQRLASRGFRRVVTPFMAMRAQALTEAGRFEEARVLLDETIATVKANGERFFTPELLRVRGGLELQRAALRGIPAEEAAKREADGLRLLGEAMEQGSADGAPLWELRAALDLAGWRLERGETGEAAALIGATACHVDAASHAPDFLRHAMLAALVQDDSPEAAVASLAPQGVTT
jgi:tetratricopeptide (TPR) repeat protein